jgi:hypothetical protein
MDIEPPATFDDLVATVHGRAATDDAAGKLEAAVGVSTEYAATADRLLDHFVAAARADAMSWTDIGAHLGVSKQAARQRFNDRPAEAVLPGAIRIAPRLQACLSQAEQTAREDGADEIGTDHLLIGLLAEGVAAAILERVGVSADAVRVSAHRLFGAASPAVSETPPMSAETARAVDVAGCWALEGRADKGPAVIRTEHVLAALALDPGSRARRVLNDLSVDIAGIKRELACYVSLNPPRPARWWKRRSPAGQTCSFCGRTVTPDGPLVHGPNVAICADCVALATDILKRRATA